MMSLPTILKVVLTLISGGLLAMLFYSCIAPQPSFRATAKSSFRTMKVHMATVVACCILCVLGGVVCSFPLEKPTDGEGVKAIGESNGNKHDDHPGGDLDPDDGTGDYQLIDLTLFRKTTSQGTHSVDLQSFGEPGTPYEYTSPNPTDGKGIKDPSESNGNKHDDHPGGDLAPDD